MFALARHVVPISGSAFATVLAIALILVAADLARMVARGRK